MSAGQRSLSRCCPAKGLAGLLWLEGGWEGGDDFCCFDADAGDLAEEADDVFGIIRAVGVGADAGAFVFGDLVLVDDPFEGGAVAEAVVEGGGRDAAEGL